jgi:hypothetical protein
MMIFVIFAMLNKTQNGEMECANVYQTITNLMERVFLILLILTPLCQIAILQLSLIINKKDACHVQMDVFHVKVVMNAPNADLNITMFFKRLDAFRYVATEKSFP